MTPSFFEQRTVLRLRLQAQRQIFFQQEYVADLGRDHFPRSMTMRLLTQPGNWSAVLLTGIAPLLLRYFLAPKS